MNDINLERLRSHMEAMEGRRNQVYDCAGLKYCGIGHLLKGAERDWPIGHTVSDNQIEAWFAEDCRVAYAEAVKTISAGAWDFMSTEQREACVDACFQLGGAGFRCFRKCVAALNRSDFSVAAVEMLDSRAAKQSPRRTMSRAKCWAYGSWQ